MLTELSACDNGGFAEELIQNREAGILKHGSPFSQPPVSRRVECRTPSSFLLPLPAAKVANGRIEWKRCGGCGRYNGWCHGCSSCAVLRNQPGFGQEVRGESPDDHQLETGGVSVPRNTTEGTETKFKAQLSDRRLQNLLAQVKAGFVEFRVLKELHKFYGIEPDAWFKQFRCPKNGKRNPRFLALREQLEKDLAGWRVQSGLASRAS